MGSGRRMNLGVRQRGIELPANRRAASGKSWRAHREIKRYAGGSEHCTIADEWMDAAGNGAAADESESADESPDESDDTAATADESERSGTAAAGAERHDRTAWIVAGSSGEADRTFIYAGHADRLHKAEEPPLEPDCAVYGDECSFAGSDKYGPVEVAAAGREDLSEPGGCSGAGA